MMLSPKKRYLTMNSSIWGSAYMNSIQGKGPLHCVTGHQALVAAVVETALELQELLGIAATAAKNMHQLHV